jgi:hypothetical protein
MVARVHPMQEQMTSSRLPGPGKGHWWYLYTIWDL